jgi:plastocyanin
LALAAIAVLVGGCGGGGDSTSTTGPASGSGSAGGGSEVTIADYTYDPAEITVSKGTTVVFANQDSTAHTATSKDSGVFESGAIEPGKSGKVTLRKTGSFAYYCAFHPFMKGTIEVE